MSQDARRLEIEAKKKKLLDLRKAREDRKNLLLSEQQKRDAGEPSTPVSASRRDIDSLVASLLGPAQSSSYGGSSGVSTDGPSPTSSAPSTPGRPSSSSAFLPPGTPSGRQSRGSEVADAFSAPTGPSGSSLFQGILPNLIDVQTELYELPPKPKVTYTKSVQTAAMSTATSTDDDFEGTDGVGSSSGRETEEDLRARIKLEFEEERRKLDEEIELEKRRLAKEVEEDRLRDLTEEQRTQIYAAPEFLEFVESSSKIVQRALSDNYDYIREYASGEGGVDEEEGKSLKLLANFSDERWTKGRSVTDLDWSPKFPELSVASYNKKPSAVNDSDGLVCVWNMHLANRPEFVFHSQTDVLSVAFSPFNSNLIFGGTYSGQVLLWDTRARHLPVLKSPLSAAGHTYPVYAMKMVGTQNAHNLITSSTDGMVCSWLADMLAQPQETLDLRHPAHTKTDEVSITALDFPANETTTFFVGTEEGPVYAADRYDRAGAKAGLNQSHIYRGHSGPVTGLSFHPLSGSVDFSDLFLSCSVDWTIKLWRTAGQNNAGGAAGTTTLPKGGREIRPVYSFEEATDYVYDVAWHPVNPAVFGAVDGTGKFDLWNLNNDTEVPTLSVQTPSSRALNKLAWDRKDGRRAALGSSDGSVYVYDIGEAAVPHESEWTDLQRTLAGLTAARDVGAGGIGVGGVEETLVGR